MPPCLIAWPTAIMGSWQLDAGRHLSLETRPCQCLVHAARCPAPLMSTARDRGLCTFGQRRTHGKGNKRASTSASTGASRLNVRKSRDAARWRSGTVVPSAVLRHESPVHPRQASCPLASTKIVQNRFPSFAGCRHSRYGAALTSSPSRIAFAAGDSRREEFLGGAGSSECGYLPTS